MKTIKITTTISNDNTIYIPPVIRKAFNFKNGGKVSLEVIDGALIIKPCFDVVNWATNYLRIHELKGFYKVGRDRVTGITTVILVNGRVGVAQCDPNDAFEVKKPFYFKDSLYFFGPELRKYVGMFLHDIINPKAMGIMLREYGFKPLDMNFKKSDKWVSRSVWKIKITEDEIAQAFLNQGMLDEANRILAEQTPHTKDE